MGLSIDSGGSLNGIHIPFISGQYYGSVLNGTVITSRALAANDFRCSPYIFPADLDFTQIRFNIQVTGTATLCKVYIFDSNAQGFPNNTPVYTSGDISINTTGIKTTTTSYTFEKNQIYWVAIQVNGIVTPYCIPAAACYNIGDSNSLNTFISLRSILGNFNAVTNFTSNVGVATSLKATQLPINFSFLKA